MSKDENVAALDESRRSALVDEFRHGATGSERRSSSDEVIGHD
jgi:hypothetical protein